MRESGGTKNIITVENNWEAYEYFLNGKEISPNKIKKVEIKYRNKKSKIFNIKRHCYNVPYNDMGHTYYAYRIDAYVNMKDELGFPIKRSLIEFPKNTINLIQK